MLRCYIINIDYKSIMVLVLVIWTISVGVMCGRLVLVPINVEYEVEVWVV
ncbi:hypothetical protein [Candidatus Hodgkinia cicadicola]